ncbi:hypothetical protein [Millisia brevis]|uniref:hypothetical protein n=1 Tax=Millisia brevis TaxID=264148 RepID=UPI00082A6E5F|nr:hypothetical protein [Millisia brevis]
MPPSERSLAPAGPEPDPGAVIEDLLDLPAGVISHRQAIDHGYRPHDIRRLLRRRIWAPILPSVYVAHTGPPSWEQRAGAAVLWAHPAALTHLSAIRAIEGPRTAGPERVPIHVLVSHSRRLRAPAGVVVHRSRSFHDRLDPWSAPSRVRYEHAVIDTCLDEENRWDRVDIIARACRGRRTSPYRIRTALENRRVPDRAWLLDLLVDVAGGRVRCSSRATCRASSGRTACRGRPDNRRFARPWG